MLAVSLNPSRILFKPLNALQQNRYKVDNTPKETNNNTIETNPHARARTHTHTHTDTDTDTDTHTHTRPTKQNQKKQDKQQPGLQVECAEEGLSSRLSLSGA